MPLPLARNSQHNGFGEDQLGVRCAAVLMSAWGQTRSFGGVGSMSGLPEGGHGGKARNTSFCAAASRPGSARVHASDNNFGQIVSHKYRLRVRTQPRLWAAARDVLRAHPTRARGGENRTYTRKSMNTLNVRFVRTAASVAQIVSESGHDNGGRVAIQP